MYTTVAIHKPLDKFSLNQEEVNRTWGAFSKRA